MTETVSEGHEGDASLSRGWRVKLYELEASGSWVDRGVGHVSVEILQFPSTAPAAPQTPPGDLPPSSESADSESVSAESAGGAVTVVPCLCVVSEENGDFLLQSRIHCDDLYERQGETMILWKEADFSTTIDYAMSFQLAEGCAAIWTEISRIQNEFHTEREYGYTPSFHAHNPAFARTHTQRLAHNMSLYVSDSHSDSGSSTYTVIDEMYEREKTSLFLVLPVYPFAPAHTHGGSAPIQHRERDVAVFLSAVKHKLDTLHPSQRDYVSAQLLNEECAYFRRLFELFNALESDRSRCVGELRALSEIFRAIFLLNDPNLIEFLLIDDAVFHSVCGIFEYDPSLREPGQYRVFLFQTSRHVHVLSSLTHELRGACVFLYRLRYVRDIMLHPTVDDPGVSAINSMITFTSSDICVQVMSDPRHMAELFVVICPFLRDSLQSLLIHTQTSTQSHMHSLSTDTLSDDALLSQQSSASSPPPTPHTPHTPQNAPSQAQTEVRAVHGVQFLRELFSLSKHLPLDKRQHLYNHCLATFSRAMRQVLLYLLGGVSLSLRRQKIEVLSGDSTAMDVECNVETDAHDNSAQPHTLTETEDEMSLFMARFSTPEEVSAVASCVGEVCASLSLVCAPALRALLAEDAHPHKDAHKDAQRSASSEGRGGALSSDALRRAFQGPESRNTIAGEKEVRHWSRGSMLYLLIDVIVNGTDAACVELCADTLKHLLDADRDRQPGPNSGPIPAPLRINGKAERDRFLRDFYDHYLAWLLAPFLDAQTPSLPVPTGFYLRRGVSFAVHTDRTPLNTSSNPDESHTKTSNDAVNPPSCVRLLSHSPQSSLCLSTSRRCISELLMLCLSAHSYRIKYFLFHENHLALLVAKAFPDPQKSQIPDDYFALTHTAPDPQTIKPISQTSSESSPNAQIDSLPDVLDAPSPLDVHILAAVCRERARERDRDRAAVSLAAHHPNRSLQLYIVKLLRCVLHAKDEFYYKYIVKHDVLRPLFAWFAGSAHRDNALCSAVHTLVDYMRAENIFSLIDYCVEKYSAVLEKARCVDVFGRLRERHAQLCERERERESDALARTTSLAGRGKRVRRVAGAGQFVDARERESAHDERYLESEEEDEEVHMLPDVAKRPRTLLYARPPSPPHYSLPHGTEVDGDTLTARPHSPHSPHRPLSPHSPHSPLSPLSPLSPISHTHAHTHAHTLANDPLSPSPSLSASLSLAASHTLLDNTESDRSIEANDAFELLSQYGEDAEDEVDFCTGLGKGEREGNNCGMTEPCGVNSHGQFHSAHSAHTHIPSHSIYDEEDLSAPTGAPLTETFSRHTLADGSSHTHTVDSHTNTTHSDTPEQPMMEDLEEREREFFSKLPPLRQSEEEEDQSGFLRHPLVRRQTNAATKKKPQLKFA